MPEISRFLVIVIRMYFDIDSGIVRGRFPRRALTAVLEWYNLHQNQLARNWELVQARQPLNPIEPLE